MAMHWPSLGAAPSVRAPVRCPAVPEAPAASAAAWGSATWVGHAGRVAPWLNVSTLRVHFWSKEQSKLRLLG